MERIIIQVRDRAKARALVDLLHALDFVDSVETSEEVANVAHRTSDIERVDFFALAGLWADREVTLDSIREQAWPRRSE